MVLQPSVVMVRSSVSVMVLIFGKQIHQGSRCIEMIRTILCQIFMSDVRMRVALREWEMSLSVSKALV